MLNRFHHNILLDDDGAFLLMSTDSIDVRLKTVNSIIKNWEGFSAQVFSYDGHPGICGRLLIILSSPQLKYFAITCGPSAIIKTRFNWNIHNLSVNYSIEFHQIYLQDDSGFYVKPSFARFSFYELLNTSLIMDIENLSHRNKNLSLLDRFDLNNSLICADTLQEQNKIFDLTDIYMGDFSKLQNILYLEFFSKETLKEKSSSTAR